MANALDRAADPIPCRDHDYRDWQCRQIHLSEAKGPSATTQEGHLKRDILMEAVLWSITEARAHGKGPDIQPILPQIQLGNDDQGTPVLSKSDRFPVGMRSGAQRSP